jgi:hypothetical protein
VRLWAKARGLFVVAMLLVISVGGVVAQAGVAQATPTLTLTPTTTVFSFPSTTTPLSGLDVTGDTTDTLQATVATTLGTLSVSSTSGLTLAYGNAWSGTASVTFTGLESAIDTGLASVSLVTTSTTGTAAVSLTAMVEQSGYNYLSANQHFYKYVSCSGCSWFTADSGAEAYSFAGQPGYLATIPNASVNAFISNNIANATNVWFGARAYESIATDGTQVYATVNGITYARVWRWTEGANESPIAGGIISECSNQTGSCNFQNSSSFFSSWNSGEPNNSGGSNTVAYQGEYTPVTNWSGTAESWNDLSPTNDSSVNGYVVEFGGKTNTTSSLGTGFAGVVTASSNLTVATSVSPPAAPTVTATPVDSSAVLSWSPPVSNGDAITGYNVSTNGGSTWTGPVSTTTTYPVVNGNVVTTINFTVTGLTDGTTYQIEVRADSAAGTGTPSTAQTITPEPAPGAPTNVTATAGDGAANVSWTAGADGGPAVDLWTVTPYNAQDVAQTGLAVTSTNPSATSLRVPGLTAGTAYTFTVTAANSMGTSPAGTSSSVTPNATLQVSTTSLSSASYNFTYTTTLQATGGTAPFTWSVVTGSLPTGLSLAPSGTISGTPTATGTATFTVQVADSDGATASGSLSVAVVASAPAAPTGASAVGGNQRAVVTFTAPTNVGSSPITHYTVTAVDSTNAANGGQSVSGSSSPITVNGLTNGDSYTFSVTATNAVGLSPSSSASSSVVPARTVPDPPTAALATAGNAQALVSFTTPTNNGGDPITGYTVTAVDLTNHTLGGQIATGATSPITLTGLTNGDIYTFTVTASNAFGASVPSSTTNSVTPVTVPGAPTIGIVTAANSTASVAFSAPVGTGGTAITGYTVTATDTTNVANGGQSATGATGPIIVSGLTNGDSYTFSVQATNAVGTGPASASSAPVVPAGPPGAPTDVTGSATGQSGTVRVTFTAPASSDGSAITGYAVTATDTTNVARGGQSATGATSPITITGLTDGDTYTFSVYATNTAGTGAGSASSAPVVPAGPPGAPTNATATGGDRQASVTFGAPASDNGAVITSYTVTAADTTDGANGGQTVTGAASPLTVSGLTNGDSYTFTVTASSPAGTSSPSSSSAPVVPAGVPGAPIDAAATGSNTSATVAFTTPANDNGASVTVYTVTATDTTNSANGGQTATGAASPLTVTGLINGDSYTFRVTASNWAGSSTASAASNTVVPAPTVPDVPTNVRATAGDTQAMISFDPPDTDGGDAITGYWVVAHDATNFDNGGQIASAANTSVTVTGLTNGDSYTFTVIATNAVGASGPSLASAAVTPAGLPGAPTDVVGTATGTSGHASVSFLAPDDNGSPIISYTVTATDITNLANLAVTATGASSPISVTGLANGDNYSYTVTATNVVGTSASSAPSGQMPSPVVGPPGAPNVTAANGTDPGTATVSWTAGTINGSTAIGWTVTPVLGGQTLSELSQSGLSVATITVSVTGLTGGETYTFDVVEHSTDGDSPAGQSGLVTMPSAPEAPTDVQATVSDTSATVSWTAGDDNGSPINLWTITPVEGDLTSTAVTVEGPGTTSVLVLGLSPSGSYIFQVVATNAVGTSPTASSASATLPAALTVSSPGSLAVGEVGVNYTDVTLAAGGGTGENSWAVLTGTPPAGLTLGANGGLSGTPTTGGSVTFTIQVTDSGSATATQEETIDIVPDPEVTGALLGGTVGTAYSQSLSGADGTSPYTWSVTTGSLPSGLTLAPSSGAIGGVPTQSGTSTFTVELTDLNGVTATEQYGITVAAAPVTPAPPILPSAPSATHTSAPGTTVEPAGSLGSSYDSNLSGPSSGGPWTWSLSGGALPPGVRLGPNGALSGMPTAGGAYSFTASAVDPNGDTYLETVVLTVSASPALPVSPVPPPVVPAGKVPFFSAGAASSFNLTAPGPGPFAWSVAPGTLPAGLQLSATGQVSGTVAIPGTYEVSFRYVAADGAAGLETVTVNVYPSDLNSRPMASTPDGKGYWVVGANGAVKAFGDAKFYGSLVGRTASPIISMAATPDGEGYWLLAADGAVSAFGNARSYGSTVTRHLNQPVVAMAVTPDGRGYWLIASDGGVFTFGNAHFYGSAARAKLHQPVVGFAAMPGGTGYWLVTSTGAVLPFGSAQSYGGLDDTKLVGAVVGIAAAPDGRGYWLAAKDGGVFAYGSAKFHGSLGRHGSPHPILGIVPTNDGGGYWLVAQDGQVWSFGDATSHGSGGLEVSPHN